MSSTRLLCFALLGLAFTACPAASDGPAPVLDEHCEDGIDNDEDGDVDCDDSDCASVFVCKNPSMDVGPAPDAGPRGDAGSGSGPGEDGGPAPAADAGGTAGDFDGGTTVAGDVGGPVEHCSDGIDNDGDMFTDCADEDCYGVGDCGGDLEICDDEIDNDGNGAVDCDDPHCAEQAVCTGENPRVTCMELMECVAECHDDACTNACLQPGDQESQTLARALWTCVTEECQGNMVCGEEQCWDQYHACSLDPPFR